MDQESLTAQHAAWHRHRDRASGKCELAPAFMDTTTGTVRLSVDEQGSPAPVHVISWLPRAWADKLGANGEILRLRRGIVAGFVQDDVFYTREQAAALIDASD